MRRRPLAGALLLTVLPALLSLPALARRGPIPEEAAEAAGRAAAATEEGYAPPRPAGGEEDGEEDLALLRETVAEGRGHRDERGVRDQWSSERHLKHKYDARRPVSPRVRALLEQYRLECDGCDEAAAVRRVNAFVREAKEEAARREREGSWRRLLRLYLLSAAAAALAAALLWFYRNWQQESGAPPPRRLVGDEAALFLEQMREQRRKAALAAEQRRERDGKAAEGPAEVGEDGIWTTAQEKQFAKAIGAYGGIPKAKARYTLVASKVDGKNFLECLLHHQKQEEEKKGN